MPKKKFNFTVCEEYPVFDFENSSHEPDMELPSELVDQYIKDQKQFIQSRDNLQDWIAKEYPELNENGR